MNSGARGTDGVASQRWTSEAVAARFAEVAADLALSLRERDLLAARVRELEAEGATWKPKSAKWKPKRASWKPKSVNWKAKSASWKAKRAPPRCELERQRAQILEYEAIIRGMKKRRTWRFTAPLRVLHDWWRRRRRERRAKKRAAAAARLEGGPSSAQPVDAEAAETVLGAPQPVDAGPPAIGTATEALGPFDALRARLIGEIAHPGRSVTIVIPCFNYGQYVKEAVDSALNQTYPFCDVVLVDDGSTDAATVDACQSLASDRLIVSRQANQGLSAARNNGAALTNSEFLMFLDADDRLHPDAVLFMLWSLLRHPDSAYVYCSQRFFGDENFVWEPQAFNGYDLCSPTTLPSARSSAVRPTTARWLQLGDGGWVSRIGATG